MSDESADGKIVRTVSLSRDLDRLLKGVALRSVGGPNKLLNDLIIEAIDARRAKGDPLFVIGKSGPVSSVKVKARAISASKKAKAATGAKAAAAAAAANKRQAAKA